MTIAYAGASRLSHRPRFSAARVLGGAIATLLLTTQAGRTQTATPAAASRVPPTAVWVCTDHGSSPHGGRPPLELAMKDGLLIEQPLGAQRYRMLTDNEHAIIAVDDYAGFEPVLGMVNVFASVVTIDKTTGNFAMTTIVSDKVLEPRTGTCRRFEQQAAGEKVLAERD